MVSPNKFQLRNPKSKTIARNVFFSLFIKGLNISVNFLTIPLVLSFLNNTQYGVWLTLTAVLGWFSLFDMGFGNGLRNHLTVAVTDKNFKEGKIYVSTTYAALFVIFGSLIIIFLVIGPLIDWVSLFNAPEYISRDLNNAVLFAICFIFVQFIVRIINVVLLAFQRTAMADFINLLVQVSILAGLFVLKVLHLYSITDVTIVYSSMPVIVFSFISVILFFTTYAPLRPSIYFVKASYTGKLLKLGIKFFIIQIAALVLYASDNFIIARLFTPADVTVYSIAFKYFGVVSFLFTVALSPFWSMTTRAHTEGDWRWIKRSVKKLKYLWALLLVVGFIQLAIAQPIFALLTNSKVIVPLTLSFIVVIYFVVSNWCSIFSNFQNGVGKIQIQLYLSIAAMIVNVPMALFLAKTCHLGIVGIPLATIFTMFAANTVALMQYNKIVHFKAKGIWDK